MASHLRFHTETRIHDSTDGRLRPKRRMCEAEPRCSEVMSENSRRKENPLAGCGGNMPGKTCRRACPSLLQQRVQHLFTAFPICARCKRLNKPRKREGFFHTPRPQYTGLPHLCHTGRIRPCFHLLRQFKAALLRMPPNRRH